MRRVIARTLMALLMGIAMTTIGWAAMEQREHQMAEDTAADTDEKESRMPGRMMPDMIDLMEKSMMGMGMMRSDKPYVQPLPPSVVMHMMSEALSGRMKMDLFMMQRMMSREFFLDRSGELGLTAQQIAELKAIRSSCRRDNIRSGAEAKIASLELDELLREKDWALQEAKALIRHMERIEADMKIRHLLALRDAKKVLTEEQREKAMMLSKDVNLEELF